MDQQRDDDMVGDRVGDMDEAVRAYAEEIPTEHRSLFDRVHRLVFEAHPEVDLVLSYGIPTYKVGRRRLYLGAWKHGVSVYGWKAGADAGFMTRHPHLRTSKGTIRIRPEDGDQITDGELLGLVRSALGP